jgi:ketosteroid isomerase-like protein
MDPEATRATAGRAFDRFKEGLATGRWQGFLDMLADDFSFHFPTGKWRGEWRGKAKAAEFLAYVSTVFPGGLEVTLDRVQCSDTTCVFEFRDSGTMVIPGQPPQPYKNRVAVSLDVRDGQIVGYREYFGSDGRST